MCFSCICLFVLYALVFVIFPFLLVSELAKFCGTPWTFLLTFLLSHIVFIFSLLSNVCVCVGRDPAM